ncbi:hypothetical protein C8J56DRAFT_867689 [Mycena floridula]|nr:hypothetical protein C8J56DRAFT_867689 [Mycena floridula]
MNAQFNNVNTQFDDAQNLATEFIWSLDTVHHEVRHLLEELKHKETRAQDLQDQVDYDSARYMRSTSDSASLLPAKMCVSFSCRFSLKGFLSSASSYAEIHALSSEKTIICHRIVKLVEKTRAHLDFEVGKIKILFGEDLPPPSFHPVTSREVTPTANLALHGRDTVAQINETLTNSLAETPQGNKRRRLTSATSAVAVSSNLKVVTPVQAASPPPSTKRPVRTRPSTVIQVTKPPKSDPVTRTTKEKKRAVMDADVEMKVEESATPEDAEDVEDDGDDKNYCLCQKPSFGDMIACDGKGCPYEWFHISCIGLKGPLGDDPWYCSHCAEAGLPGNVSTTTAPVPKKRGRPSAGESRH